MIRVQLLDERLERIVEQTAAEAAEEIRRQTDTRRRRTRDAVFVEIDGTRVIIGLRFDREYPGDTPTARHFRNVWFNHVRPIVLQRLEARINQAIQTLLESTS
ncbi:MAG: hypothetical protein KDA96_10175 [Planctomycetaceae bacterium]|nr:hypothetical protein [Planctomycetaceae bacterium]